MKSIKKLTLSAAIIALYVVAMYVSQWFASGMYQLRIATSIYALSYLYPFLILPLGLANFLGNFYFGGLGPIDWAGGFVAGVITSECIYMIRRFKLNDWLIAVVITFVPGLLVPVWLSGIFHVPYVILAFWICLGQVVPGLLGVLLVKKFRGLLPKL